MGRPFYGSHVEKSNLDLPPPETVGCPALLEGVDRDDADIQAAEQAPDCQARFSVAHGRPLGSGCSFAPSQEGAEAFDSFHRLQARPRLIGDERFARSRRLVRAAEVRRVVTLGHRLRRAHLDIFWTTNEAGHPRFGLVVAKARETGVARNRQRRRLKEVWRRDIQQQLPAWDVVVRTRREAYAAPFNLLRADLLAWREASAG